MLARQDNQKLTPHAATAPDIDDGDRLKRSALIERFFNLKLRLSQLRVLVAIADLGQLKRVAAALHVTPPAISKQVAEIEESLQHAVTTRLGNRIEFTPLGALLARRAREVLAQIECARIEVDELCSGAAGTLGIGVVPTVASLFVPVLVTTLKTRAPNAAIRIYEHHFDRLAPMLADGTIDLAVARETTHPLSSGFVEEQVMEDPVAIVCAVQHRLLQKARLAWADLQDVPWILPMRGSSTYMHLESLLLRHGLTVPQQSIESNALSATIGLLRAYPFVALMPLAYARSFDQPHGLSVLPLSTQGMQGAIKAVWRRGNRNPVVALLAEAMRQHVVML